MAEKSKRGRPRKVPVAEDENILSEEAGRLQMSQGESKVTVEELSRSLTGIFSQALKHLGPYDALSTLNQYNPFLQNTRLKMISSYPAAYSPEEIGDMLKAPQSNEQQLRSASWSLSASQYLYYKILREAADVPLYKHYVIPPTLTESEYLSPAFVKEEEFVDDWLSAFDIPNTLKRVALETKREGKATYLFRQCIEEKKGKRTPKYVIWQKLPSDYTKLTAIGEHGFIASFNMLIFLNPAFTPLQYPEYIREIWEDLINHQIVIKAQKAGNYTVDYNALRTYSYRGNNGSPVQGTLELAGNSYMYWVQLPQDLCFTFSSDSSNAWAVPDTIGLFNALQELTDYSTLAGLVQSSPLTSILTGEAEICPNAQPGQDQVALSPHTMIAFQNAFNSMVAGNIQAFLAPFKNMKLQSLPNIPNASDIKTKAVQNFVAMAGEGGIISATDKPSVAMVKGAQMMSAAQYDFVTRQFETILNANLANWCGLKYRWDIHLWGDIFTFDSTVKSLKEMVANGYSYLLPKLASAHDLSMRNVRGINAYIKAHKIFEGLQKLGAIAAEDESENPVGRPPMDENDIENDATAASRDAGNNVSDIKEFALEGKCIICGADVDEGHIICEECEAECQIEERGEYDEKIEEYNSQTQDNETREE